jgi:hypothetical protein
MANAGAIVDSDEVRRALAGFLVHNTGAPGSFSVLDRSTGMPLANVVFGDLVLLNVLDKMPDYHDHVYLTELANSAATIVRFTGGAAESEIDSL